MLLPCCVKARAHINTQYMREHFIPYHQAQLQTVGDHPTSLAQNDPHDALIKWRYESRGRLSFGHVSSGPLGGQVSEPSPMLRLPCYQGCVTEAPFSRPPDTWHHVKESRVSRLEV